MWARIAARAARVRGDVLLAALDVALVSTAFLVVLFLRFDGNVPAGHWERFQAFLPVAIVVSLASNVGWGLYGQLWRHASTQEAQRLLCAGMTTLAILVGYESLSRERVPASVIIFGVVFGTFLLGAVRFQSRLFSFRRKTLEGPGLRVVVIGAGDAGAALVREMQRSPRVGLLPVAVLDEDERHHGRSFMGLRIHGGIAHLPQVAASTGAHQAVLAMSSPSGDVVRRAAAAAEEAGVVLRIVPGLAKTVGEGINLHDVRDIQIEDLLGRDEVVTDLEAVRRLLGGRRVLITGAGGSIGSEIARQVAACDPASLVLVDHDETHVFEAALSIERPVVQVLADIRDRDLVLEVFERHRPDVVFHAAAHKHVPLLEEHPCEAVSTNVLGTENVIDGAVSVGTGHFVLISTDKAVRPSNVMGASKRLSEQLLLARRHPGGAYCAVRFGNVLGSRGSVIPTFMRQIHSGGPVTVTDPRMTRFFMTIPEACQLVLQSAALAEGGEIFMLDMGEPVQIIELAERMIRMTGRRVGHDIEIRVTGIRPGEKLTEELYEEDEQLRSTAHPSISCLAPPATDPERIHRGVADLRVLAAGRRGDLATAKLFELIGVERPVPAAVDGLDGSDADVVIDLREANGAMPGSEPASLGEPG